MAIDGTETKRSCIYFSALCSTPANPEQDVYFFVTYFFNFFFFAVCGMRLHWKTSGLQRKQNLWFVTGIPQHERSKYQTNQNKTLATNNTPATRKTISCKQKSQERNKFLESVVFIIHLQKKIKIISRIYKTCNFTLVVPKMRGRDAGCGLRGAGS